MQVQSSKGSCAVSVFTPENLDDALQWAAEAYCTDDVEINLDKHYVCARYYVLFIYYFSPSDFCVCTGSSKKANSGRQVVMSGLFQQYFSDFGRSKVEVLQFCERYAPEEKHIAANVSKEKKNQHIFILTLKLFDILRKSIARFGPRLNAQILMQLTPDPNIQYSNTHWDTYGRYFTPPDEVRLLTITCNCNCDYLCYFSRILESLLLCHCCFLLPCILVFA